MYIFMSSHFILTHSILLRPPNKILWEFSIWKIVILLHKNHYSSINNIVSGFNLLNKSIEKDLEFHDKTERVNKWIVRST